MHQTFLCGCPLSGKPSYPPPTKDSDGFLTCPEHGVRQYGWASQLKTLFPEKKDKDGRVKLNIRYNPANDLRDNRDPVLMGQEVLAKRNGHGN